MNPAPIRNALTIDVEDYFHVYAFASHIPRDSWDKLPCRVERNVETILALLEEHDARATYFVLGWVAERYPALVRRKVAKEEQSALEAFVREYFRQVDPDDLAERLAEDLYGVALSHWAFARRRTAGTPREVQSGTAA